MQHRRLLQRGGTAVTWHYARRPKALSPEPVHLHVALWYEIDIDHSVFVAVINQDLEALKLWGDDNKTAFEPEKMSAMVISQKRKPFDASGIIFNNEELSVVDDTTLVGLKIDRRMRWGPVINKLAVKGYSSGHPMPGILLSEVFFSLDLVNLVYNNNRN